MGRLKALAVAVTAAALALAACGPAQGPAGTVTGKDQAYRSATKQWTYKLTVRQPDGTESTFRVLRADYRDCYRGSAYPKCTAR
jgi:ABC-type glycerol-3-phosphate transport system substrate-binding protein